MPPLWIVLTLLPILGGAERFNCRTRILGAYYADAKSGCKAFHVCVRVAGGGIRDFRFFCPPGTLFHQEAQTCTDWGDDDPLACPAEIYDGQFDLYKIGSGFDTKKLSAPSNRDEETEFGLQRAETGDRRLSQSQSQSNGASDLRAAHSSDFFSGQRERGRDESVPSPQSTSRQSFRRPTSSRQYSYSSTQSTTQYTTPSPSSSPQPSSPSQYEGTKRKLVRKRPIYVSTPAPPSTFVNSQNTQSTQSFSEPQQQKQQQQSFEKYFQAKQRVQSAPQQQPNQPQTSQQQQPLEQQQQYQRPPQQKQYQPKQQPQPQQQQQHQQYQQQQQQQQQYQPQQKQQHYRPQPPPQPQKYESQSQQTPPQQSQQYQSHQQQKPQQQSQQYQPQQQQRNNNNYENIHNRSPQNRAPQTTPEPSVPVQFKEYRDEYVEVPRVTPKQRYFPTNPSPAPFSQTTPALPFSKKDGLVELYNYDSQSTPGINDNRPFKVRNSFSVTDVPRDPDFVRTRNNFNTNNGRTSPTTLDYSATATGSTTNTPAFRNYNSVSYETEKNNFVSIGKQNYFNSPSTTPTTTTYYTTTRSEPPANLNTVAYNTNIGFNVPSNFGENDEDDGQYRLSENEDDGQYKPELYDRELLSGAHSLNIAASGNRLPEDQKPRGKAQISNKLSQTAAPRPFRPAPTPTLPPTTRNTEYTEQSYSTTNRPQTANTQRTFDYYQTYTTTSRPVEPPPPLHLSHNNAPAKNVQARPSTSATKAPEPRPPPPPTVKPKHVAPSPPPSFSRPASEKEDNSYDYAYYDTDPGFSEYDRIEEFGKTHAKA